MSRDLIADTKFDELGGRPWSRTASHRATATELEIVAGAREHGISVEEYNSQVACGKVIDYLMAKEQRYCCLSKSICEAAFVMPEVCRSGNWAPSMTNTMHRVYLFMFLNYALQLTILYMFAQTEQVVDKFSGQMFLCNFGADVQHCPDAPNCIGPGGTNYQNASRMYSFRSWMLRTFVKDSLKQIFPEKAGLAESSMDPGEYGLESYWVRFVCVFVFMLSVLHDLRGTYDMINILWYVPTKAEAWLSYEVPSWASKAKVKEILDVGELDFVKIRIAGIPRSAKIRNILLIIVPRLFIWVNTAKFGVMFLMETSGIEDTIVNVTALTYILDLDDLVFATFFHGSLHHIMDKLEPWEWKNVNAQEHVAVEEAFQAVVDDSKGPALLFRLLPWRPVLVLMLSVFFVWDYYATHCEVSPTGAIYSKALSLPKQQLFPVLNLFIPWLGQETEEEPFWSMPSEHEEQ